MNRRDFLKHSANAGTLLAFSSLVPSFLTRSAVAAGSVRNGKPTALVVVQLSGGNDGLNTVIPFEDATGVRVNGHGVVVHMNIADVVPG